MFSINFKAFKKKKSAVRLAKFIIYKTVNVITHFVIIVVSYLALIRLLFVELGFHQIRRKYILYYYDYTTNVNVLSLFVGKRKMVHICKELYPIDLPQLNLLSCQKNMSGSRNVLDVLDEMFQITSHLGIFNTIKRCWDYSVGL